MTQSENDQPRIYYCRKCYIETRDTKLECPKCGKKMNTQSHIKSLGQLMIVLGTMLSLCFALGVLGVISVLLFAELDKRDVVLAIIGFGFSGSGLALGITIAIGGTWQKKNGRASRTFVRVFNGFVVLMLLAGGLFMFLS